MLKVVILGAVLAWPAPVFAGTGEIDEFSHGGGCQKASPAGVCCHVDRRTGVYHCH